MITGLTDMSPAGKIDFLVNLLDEVDERESCDPNQVEREWRSGNLQYFANGNVSEARDHPEQHRVLLTDRNSIWTDTIRHALEKGERTLIVGGTAHFVGEQSVIQMLKKKSGIRADQVKSWHRTMGIVAKFPFNGSFRLG